MDDLKRKVESVLFSAGTKVPFEEIVKLVKERDNDKILTALNELKTEYDQRASSLMVIQDGNNWKLTVRETYLPIVRKIVTQTELPKGVMETLAVVASKAPVLQSKIIDIRTNKAYDHLAELEQAGYITRAKHGRTKLIKLTEKFFTYFDIPEDQLRNRFNRAKELEQAIAEKEAQLAERHAEIASKQDEAKQRDEADKQKSAEEHQRLDTEIEKLPAVQVIDEHGHANQLDVYDLAEGAEAIAQTGTGVEVVEDKLGQLEVVDLPQEPAKPKTRKHAKKKSHKHAAQTTAGVEAPATEEAVATETDATLATQPAESAVKQESQPTPETPRAAGDEPAVQREWTGEGLFKQGIPEHVAKRVDERVQEMLAGGEHKEPEPNQESTETFEDMPAPLHAKKSGSPRENDKDAAEPQSQPPEESQDNKQ